jgi:hypothetical protein
VNILDARRREKFGGKDKSRSLNDDNNIYTTIWSILGLC